MNPLQLVSDRQGVWSATANRLKARYERARWTTFALSILGAVLSAVASQMPEGVPRTRVAVAAAVLFAIVTFLTARVLGSGNATGWLRARSASEALKREAYKYAAGAAPYDDEATRNAKLNHEREEIEKGVDEIIGHAVSSGRGSAPTSPLTPEAYVEARIQRQIREYFEPKGDRAQRIATALRWAEAALALGAACLAAVAAVVGKQKTGWGFEVDLAALLAVLTTIAGTVAAHMAAGRYDFTVANYRSTARRLRNAVAAAPEKFVAPSPEWSAFVNECEAILWDANNTWIAKWTKP